MRASARRLIFGFLLLFSSLFLIVPHALAQTPAADQEATQNSSAQRMGLDSDVPVNLHTATQVVMLESMAGILCQLTGEDYIHPNQKCLGVDPKTGKIGFVGNGGGMIGVMGSAIGYTLTPPASSIQYISYLKNNFGINKHAYAAEGNTPNPCDQTRGIGFCGLWPIVDLWIAMRNIVYLIFILVFFVIGLGIMLRLHIDPQTVMSVQNQIPKIIIGIVAITFSFAIAGFLIDVMWVATYLFGSVIASAANGPIDYINVIKASTPFEAVNNSFGGVIGGIGHIAGASSDAFTLLIKDTLNGTTNAFSGIPIFGDVILGFINILAFLIIAIAIIVSLIRLWVILILSYLNLILDVVFAPFWILAGTFPGSPLNLGSWIRDVISNLAVYPLTIAFFLLADVFVQAFDKGTSIDRFIPPLLGGVSSTTISALIGLGFLLIMPNVLTTTKAALKTPKIDLGPLLGPVGAGARTLTGAARGYGATQLASREFLPTGDATKPWEKRGLGKAVAGRLFGGR